MSPNLEGRTNTVGNQSLRNHTVPTFLANTGRSKVIPLKIGQALSIHRTLGGQIQKGPSNNIVGGLVVCWNPSYPLKNQRRGRSTSLGWNSGHQAHFLPLIRLSLPRVKLSSCRFRAWLSTDRCGSVMYNAIKFK